MIQLICKISL